MNPAEFRNEFHKIVDDLPEKYLQELYDILVNLKNQHETVRDQAFDKMIKENTDVFRRLAD